MKSLEELQDKQETVSSRFCLNYTQKEEESLVCMFHGPNDAEEPFMLHGIVATLVGSYMEPNEQINKSAV